MWQGQDKVWLQFRQDVLATDIASGIFLCDYLRHISIHNLEIKYLEVADLHSYRLHKAPKKVNIALRNKAMIPFVFVLGKN